MDIPPALTYVDSLFGEALKLSWNDIFTAGVFAVMLTGYYILVFHFYHFICRRDTFRKDTMQYIPGLAGVFEMIAHVGVKFIKYGILFPIVSFLWFVGFAVLVFLGSNIENIQEVALIAIGIISAARILAYINERIAEEFTQTLPIIVLCILLVQTNIFDSARLALRIADLPQLGPAVFQYVFFLSALEMILRTLYVLKHKLIGHPHKVMGLEDVEHVPQPVERKRPNVNPDSFLPQNR